MPPEKIKSETFIDSNKMAEVSLKALLRSITINKDLILAMSKREVHGRYRGSLFGVGWSLINPLFMLIVYTFIFSEIFQARWPSGEAGSSKIDFAIIIFSGLIFVSFLSEVLTRSPMLIVANSNYVKKVVFPLEILPLIAVLTALFHSLVSMAVLFAALILSTGGLNYTVLYLPIIIAPLIIVATGLSWFLASLGVYIRDIGQFVSVVVMLLNFLSPVFYPISAVPEKARFYFMLNPLSITIEQARNVLIYNIAPDFYLIAGYLIFSVAIAWVCFFWFQKTRKGFADVI